MSKHKESPWRFLLAQEYVITGLLSGLLVFPIFCGLVMMSGDLKADCEALCATLCTSFIFFHFFDFWQLEDTRSTQCFTMLRYASVAGEV